MINNRDTDIRDIAIIGGGPCGLFAAFQAGMLNMSASIIDRLSEIGGQCAMLYPEKPIYDIPSRPKVSALQLIKDLEEQIKPFNINFVMNSTIDDIHFEDGIFIIKSENDVKSRSRAVIIASGGGIFDYNRPPLKNLDNFEERSIFYAVQNKEDFRNKSVVIAGGGDSAVDWAISLGEIAKKVYIVHRRNKFRALPASVEKMKLLCDEGVIEIVAPYQIDELLGDSGDLRGVILRAIDGSECKEIAVERALFCFGLSMKNKFDWGLRNDGKHFYAEPGTMQTNRPGIFVIGDVCTYPGKLKLILTGFSEAAMACHAAYAFIHPDKQLHFEHSTSKMAGNA